MKTAKELYFEVYNRKKNEVKDFKTVRFSDNWNNKLYGKYFTTIRNKNYPIDKNTLCDIELKGKGIKLARVIGCDIVRFGDLSEATILIDTGYDYSNALRLFKNFGLDVNNFDLEVKFIMFETC